MSGQFPLLPPLYPAGREPLPPGVMESDRDAYLKTKQTEKFMGMAMESCIVKSALSGGAGEPLILNRYSLVSIQTTMF